MPSLSATKIWLILMAITIVAFVFSRLGYEGQSLIAVVMLGAWIKGQMIIDHFMGLKHVRLLWRVIVSSWLIIILSTIASLYLAYG